MQEIKVEIWLIIIFLLYYYVAKHIRGGEATPYMCNLLVEINYWTYKEIIKRFNNYFFPLRKENTRKCEDLLNWLLQVNIWIIFNFTDVFPHSRTPFSQFLGVSTGRYISVPSFPRPLVRWSSVHAYTASPRNATRDATKHYRRHCYSSRNRSQLLVNNGRRSSFAISRRFGFLPVGDAAIQRHASEAC
jgi:hypothetical protein